MRFSLAISILSLVVALFALIGSSSIPPAAPSSPSAPVWEARVAALEAQIVELTSSLEDSAEISPKALQHFADVSNGGPQRAQERAIANMRHAVDQVRTGEGESPTSERNLTRTRAALASIQREALEDRIGHWVDQERIAGEKKVAEVVAAFSLGSREESRVREIFAAEEETRLSLITDLWGDDPSADRNDPKALTEAWDWAVEEMKSARATRDEALAQALGPDWESKLSASSSTRASE